MPLCRFLKICACSLLLCLLATAPALAADAETAADEEIAADEETAAALADAEALAADALLSADGLPQLGASAVYVMEAHSGAPIFSVNGDAPLPPASTGKIVTALLALDMAGLDERTTVSARAAAVEEMSLYLRAGEELTLADLLTGALVHSGNDACYAIAEAVAGSEPLFVHWLNMKAAALGAYQTRLKNTNGLPLEGHTISAADLALLTSYAMQDPFFAGTVASKQATLGEGASFRSYKNTNKLLWQDTHIVGVKTGTTDAAGHCLVAAYADGPALFISVVFHSPDRYGESLLLLRHAAASYALLCPVAAGEALAFWPDGAGGGSLLYAAEDVRMLVKRAEMADIRVRWELPRRLVFLNAAGEEIGATALREAAAPQEGISP